MSTNIEPKIFANAQLSAETKLTLMMELARKISAALDLDAVLNLIIEMVHPFIRYDSAGIYIVETKGKHKRILAHTSRGYEANRSQCAYLKVGDGIVGWAIKTGNGVIVPDVTVDSRYISGRASTRSELVAPIRASGKVIGAFNLECDQLDAYSKYDLEILMFFANQAAISIEKAMLHKALIEKKRMEAELAVAQRVQKSLLPKINPIFGHFEIAGLNKPIEEVGGDYFDFINIGGEHLGVVIADVSGKGVPAALIMATFRASLRAQVYEECNLPRTFRQLNMVLRESDFTDQFVTACYLDLHVTNYQLTYANAGHNRPLVVHPDGSFDILDNANRVLGLLPLQHYDQFNYTLKQDDMLVLYTDGITEATNDDMEEFGMERLVASAYMHRELSAAELVQRVYQEVRNFTGNHPIEDDCTLIVIKVH